MKTFSPELLGIVRLVASDMSATPIGEITLESHIYWDLEWDSMGMVEFIIALEEEFNLRLDDMEYSFDPEGINSWNDYTRAVEKYAEKALGKLDFSLYVQERVLEIEALSEEYGVLPFSIGFVCAFVSRRLDALALS